MKKLSNMKLINWHRFVNTDFRDFEKVNLLTGENGSGKTTILDAIQYVLLASSSSFNSAAHLNGKRKVTTYVRSKTGRENQAFDRKGSITSHIALEFYEESTDTNFVIGAVIDSPTEAHESTIRYIIEGKKLEDITFVENDVPLNIKEFKSVNKIVANKFFRTAKSAKTAIANRLGRLENRFFELIPKSIAFKPIDDIEDFVFTYVLDEKSVDIDDLQDIILSYTDLENILKNAQVRLSELEVINELYAEVNKQIELENKYDYYLMQAEHDQMIERMKRLETEINILADQAKEIAEKIKQNEQDSLHTSQLIDDLKIEMSNNETFTALENQRKKLRELDLELTHSREEVDKLKRKSNETKKLLGKLKANGYELESFDTLEKVCSDLMDISNIAETKALLSLVIELKKEEENNLRYERFGKINERDKLVQELKGIENEINLLEHNQRSYPDNTRRLYQKLKEVFREKKTGSEPHILCEVLEIENEEWRDAVEGYLNTQRFYIIVDPEYYDLALSVYDELREKKKAYGVGLINAEKLGAYDLPVPETLGTVVTSKNIYAERYINWLLRGVYLCQNKEDLKKHKAGITKKCLKYQNRVVSAINPKIFEIPWIGEKSYAVQLRKAKQKKRELEKKIFPIEKEIKTIEKNLELLKTGPEDYLFHHLDELSRFKHLEEEIKKCRDRIAELEKDKTIVEKQNQLKKLEQERRRLLQESNDIHRDEGRITEREKTKKCELEESKRVFERIGQEYNEILQNNRSNILDWEKDYKKALKGKEFGVFITNFERRRKATLNKKDDTTRELLRNMDNYNRSHNFGAPALLESYPEYEAAYQQLKSTEILEYEEKVVKAREKAEEEFKEQFLSKLNENIKQAQQEFKQLNEALRDITFNGESYTFTCKPSREKQSYYDMIMDTDIVGNSIFSGSFFDKHKEEIEELFNQLTQGEDDAHFEEMMDYRNYLDFDIKITHEDNSVSLYSKVCEEKSGGETQTPFYVAIAASFVQLYKNSISDEAAGLIMFDEAFNNMDDERIAGVLSFIRKLPLQVFIAAPTDRTQYIIPYTDQTIAIYSHGKRNYISEYSNLNLLEDEPIDVEPIEDDLPPRILTTQDESGKQAAR